MTIRFDVSQVRSRSRRAHTGKLRPGTTPTVICSPFPQSLPYSRIGNCLRRYPRELESVRVVNQSLRTKKIRYQDVATNPWQGRIETWTHHRYRIVQECHSYINDSGIRWVHVVLILIVSFPNDDHDVEPIGSPLASGSTCTESGRIVILEWVEKPARKPSAQVP